MQLNFSTDDVNKFCCLFQLAYGPIQKALTLYCNLSYVRSSNSYYNYVCDSNQLAPEMNKTHISEDPKTGEVSLPGIVVVKIRDLDQFLQVVQIGESNRHATNTKMNTKSSRCHVILMVSTM